MSQELENADRILIDPTPPVCAIIGGAKVSDKIGLIRNLTQSCDDILIGGAMSYTFLLAMGHQIGNSLSEPDKVELAGELIEICQNNNCELHLPIDHLVVAGINKPESSQISENADISPDSTGVDIGPKTIELYREVISKSRTILWNGPMGIFEIQAYANGTRNIAQAVAAVTKNNQAYSLIGGGDSVAAINQLGFADQVSFISTGGGAMLKLLEGKELPGIAAIR